MATLYDKKFWEDLLLRRVDGGYVFRPYGRFGSARLLNDAQKDQILNIVEAQAKPWRFVALFLLLWTAKAIFGLSLVQALLLILLLCGTAYLFLSFLPMRRVLRNTAPISTTLAMQLFPPIKWSQGQTKIALRFSYFRITTSSLLFGGLVALGMYTLVHDDAAGSPESYWSAMFLVPAGTLLLIYTFYLLVLKIRAERTPDVAG
jgi:hypothetical protein